MDPQEPTINPTVLVPRSPVSLLSPQSPQSPQGIKDSHWISILAMAIFVVLTLGVVAFLYYQNQALKSMLATYQTPIASPTPIPSPTATIDPTANWLVYTNTKYNFTFKYPNNWNLRLFAGSQELATTASSFAIEGPYQNMQTLQGGPDYSVTIKVVTKQPSDTSTPDKLVSSKALGDNKYLEFDLISSTPNQAITDTKIFDQILSTFKFTTATSSGSPTPVSKACTQEAKLCPDGSSVGRTGPNCEFAPCP